MLNWKLTKNWQINPPINNNRTTTNTFLGISRNFRYIYLFRYTYVWFNGWYLHLSFALVYVFCFCIAKNLLRFVCSMAHLIVWHQWTPRLSPPTFPCPEIWFSLTGNTWQRYTIKYDHISFVWLLYLNFLQNQESAVLMYDLALTYILRSSLMVSRSGSSPTRTITTRWYRYSVTEIKICQYLDILRLQIVWWRL